MSAKIENVRAHLADWPSHMIVDLLNQGSESPETIEVAREILREREQDTALEKGPRLAVQSIGAVEPEPISWLWDGWLARGKLHLFGGHPGDGKSFVTAALGAAFSSGAILPDGQRAPIIRTLYLIAEDDVGDTLRPRLDLHNARFDDNRLMVVDAVQNTEQSRAMFSLSRHLPLLEQVIRDHEIDLLIIDPLSAFTPGQDRNSEDARDVLMPLVDLIKETNIAALGIMHVGKPNAASNRTPLQMLLGATAYGAVARLVWMLAADPDNETRRILGVVKSNVGLKPRSLEFDLVKDGPLNWRGESDRDIAELMTGGRGRDRQSPERQRIIDILNASARPMGPQAIADALGKNISTIRNQLRALDQAGDVIRPATGIYATPTHRFIDSIDSEGQKSIKSTESSNLWPRETLDSREVPASTGSGRKCAWCDGPLEPGRTRLCRQCTGEDQK